MTRDFYAALRDVLEDNDLLDSCFVLGPRQAKQYFKKAAKVSIGGQDLPQAIAAGEDVAKHYFLFGVAATIDESLVQLAQEHRVTVVPAINTFRYPAESHREQAGQDAARLLALGVTHFQIDSMYHDAFAEKQ